MCKKLCIWLLAFSLTTVTSYSQKIDIKEDKALINSVLLWQLDSYAKKKPKAYSRPLSELSWLNGALFRGIVEWGKYDNNPACFEFIKRVGNEYDWQLQPDPYHADHVCMGQAYTEMYRIYNDQNMIEAVKKRLDSQIDNPSGQQMDFRKGHGRWTWCDALFMAPPVFAAMYSITEDERYLNFMDQEYKAAVDHLFDPQYGLFYRDTNFFDRKEKNGNPIFWGRGNGWVFGGLPLIMNELGKDHPSYKYYEDLFKTMADAILKYQDEKGSWHAGLLDYETHTQAENSGSSFFTYGLAWGVNNKILKGAKYKKAALKGWSALKTYVDKDGMLGNVQQVAAAPGVMKPGSTAVYGVGAFLLAGIEILKMNE